MGDFNPSEWIRIATASDRTVQITQFNPFKPSMELEIYIPRKTHPRLRKLVQHVLSSQVTVNTEFQIHVRGHMDASEYENNRNNMLEIAQQLHDACMQLDLTPEDDELLEEMREEIAETFGISWRQNGGQFTLKI
ncbi:biofilm formation regulator BssR [Paenibacillus pabuli]|uniref:biofilm formation regulator BssR n=1 Tax=Paenibacillus pabuli TaxID=1472 RepID=UPI003242142F